MTAAAVMSVVAPEVGPAVASRRRQPEFTWDMIARRAPQMRATMTRYLDQIAVSAEPSTVESTDLTLRQFAGRITEADPACRCVAHINRTHFEDYKSWLARRPGRKGTLAGKTIGNRLGQLRTFFERTIEWGYDDAPARVPIFAGDFPQADEPLPKFLDDPTAAKFMAALAIDPDPRRRLMVELLARTGMRSGELSGLDDEAMVRIGETHWLRIPVGKLHNDRYVPLHPLLVELITNYRASRTSQSGRLVERNDGRPYERRTIHRYVAAVAKRAEIGLVYPHQLRHTLATQAINRGMSLEAIAALLGHRSMKMTLTYAKITDTTVAAEYFRVTAEVEAAYAPDTALAASVAGARMTQLAEDHRRLLGNGHCNRPAVLGCEHESICERCGFFETGPEFVPVLIRQRDHAADHNQPDRANLFTGLLDNLDNTT